MNTPTVKIRSMKDDEVEHAVEVDANIAWQVFVVEDEAHRQRVDQANAEYWRKYPEMAGDILFAA